MENNGIAFLHASDPGTDREDISRSLMSKKMRQELVGALGAIDLTELRSTDAAVLESDEDLPHMAGIRHFYFVDDEWRAEFNENRR
jgi:hypothetical protein